MSYILDALKKSDQQRQRGMKPTLHTSQTNVIALQQPAYLFYTVLAAILICAGIAIGWLRPWQPEQALPEVKSIVAKSTIARTQPSNPVPQTALLKIPQQPIPEMLLLPPTPEPVVLAQVSLVQKQDKPDLSIPKVVAKTPKAKVASVPEKTTPIEAAPDQREVWAMAELPASIQQAIPKMSISGLVYSGDHEGRLVGINDQLMREGEYLVPGLKLEQITPDGVIFSFKKYRFRL